MIAIIGGGISGLSLAFELRNRGAPVTVFEAASRVGGTIQSTTNDGFITEAGPNGFLDREPATRALAAALGLADQIRAADSAAKRRFVYTRGALREVRRGHFSNQTSCHSARGCESPRSSSRGEPRTRRMKRLPPSRAVTWAGRRRVFWWTQCRPASSLAIPRR